MRAPVAILAALLATLLTGWLLWPLLTPVHVEGFTASVASLAIHLDRDLITNFDTLQPLSNEYFGLSKLGWVLGIAWLMKAGLASKAASAAEGTLSLKKKALSETPGSTIRPAAISATDALVHLRTRKADAAQNAAKPAQSIRVMAAFDPSPALISPAMPSTQPSFDKPKYSVLSGCSVSKFVMWSRFR